MRNNKVYTCSECDLSYIEKGLAKQCEDWCKKHDSCNLEIAKHAINKNEL